MRSRMLSLSTSFRAFQALPGPSAGRSCTVAATIDWIINIPMPRHVADADPAALRAGQDVEVVAAHLGRRAHQRRELEAGNARMFRQDRGLDASRDIQLLAHARTFGPLATLHFLDQRGGHARRLERAAGQVAEDFEDRAVTRAHLVAAMA